MASSRYRIVLRGRLSKRFESAFDGMSLEHGPNRTMLTGDIHGQAQLYGLIGRLQEFGIELLAVEPADSSEPGAGLLPEIHPAAGPDKPTAGATGPAVSLLAVVGERTRTAARAPSGREPACRPSRPR